MAYCGKCGSAVGDGVAFCPNCGAAMGVAGGPPPPPAYPPPYPAAPVTSGLDKNVAGLLCYLGAWVTGIIFLLIDKRPFVRFHAAQSIVLFGGLTVVRIALSILFAATIGLGFGMVYSLIFGVLWLVGLVAWIWLMIQAYQGREYELPVIGPFARSLAGKVN